MRVCVCECAYLCVRACVPHWHARLTFAFVVADEEKKETHTHTHTVTAVGIDVLLIFVEN